MVMIVVIISVILSTTITGGPSKWDLRWTQKPIYSSIFTNNIGSYLLSSSVKSVVRGEGIAPEIALTKSVRINERAGKHIWLVF